MSELADGRTATVDPSSPPSRVLDPEPQPRRVVTRAASVVVALAVFGFVLRWRPVDEPLARWLNGAHTGPVGALATAAYHAVSPAPAILLTMVATGLLWWWTRRLRVAAAFAGTVALTWIPSDVLKLVVDRPRPDAGLLPHPFLPQPADPSFPSGHAVFVAAFVLSAVLVLRGTPWHRPAAVVGGIAVVVVALALVVDAVHFPTDVLASLGWAMAVTPAARWLWVDVVLARIPSRGPEGRRVRPGGGAP